MTKVLILDQSKSMRKTLRERLEYEGYAIEATEDVRGFRNVSSNGLRRSPHRRQQQCFAARNSLYRTRGRGRQPDSARRHRIPRRCDGLPDQAHRHEPPAAVHTPHHRQPGPVPLPKQRMSAHAMGRARRTRASSVQPIIGSSNAIGNVRQVVERIAAFDTRTLITGENGTGKELVARWLHAKSNRAGGSFVEVNCAAIPSELIESELFGHERGAFTSAIKQRRGKFEQATAARCSWTRSATCRWRRRPSTARPPREQDLPRRQRQGHRGQRTRHRRHEQEPARGDPEGQFPRRPLPPSQRHRHPRPAPARTLLRRSRTDAALRRRNLVPLRHPAQADRLRRHGGALGDAVERQCPRTAQRHRTAHHPQRRHHHDR